MRNRGDGSAGRRCCSPHAAAPSDSTATAEAADSPAAAAPTVESTTYLGPFAGEGAALHPDNVTPQPIAFYGTDLGFTYQHGEQLQILFGDSWATESYAPIEASTGSRFDDGFGTIDLREGFDPGTHHAGQHSADQARAEPGHDRDVGDRSRARDGPRQDADGGLQQRHARIRRVQHRQAAGLHEGCGVQQRPHMRHDAGLFRQPVLAAGERHHRLSGRHARLHQRHDVRCGGQARAVERALHGPNEPAAQRAGVEPAERDRHPGTDRRARHGHTEAVRRHPRVADQQVRECHDAHGGALRPGRARSRTIDRRRARAATAASSSGGVRASSGSRRTDAVCRCTLHTPTCRRMPRAHGRSTTTREA